eukprot:4892396-Prorocentrum_lima.AAC.1
MSQAEHFAGDCNPHCLNGGRMPIGGEAERPAQWGRGGGAPASDVGLGCQEVGRDGCAKPK